MSTAEAGDRSSSWENGSRSRLVNIRGHQSVAHIVLVLLAGNVGKVRPAPHGTWPKAARCCPESTNVGRAPTGRRFRFPFGLACTGERGPSVLVVGFGHRKSDTGHAQNHTPWCFWPF